MTNRRILALLLTGSALVTAGCGAEMGSRSAAGSGGNELASSDSARVLVAKRAIDAQCGDEGGTTTADALAAAVGTLSDITKSYPNRVYETGNVSRATEMTTIASQTAEQLRSVRLPDQAARLTEAAAG